jgi:pimeloyl-ACP methyl ester carboxylesterase
MKDVVFLHGGSHGSWCWAPLLEALRKKPGPWGRLIALDMPGCGQKRGRGAGGLTMADIARALNDEVRAAGVGGAVLLGHSIAGMILPLMALDSPALFSALFHLATIAPAEGQTIGELHAPEEMGMTMDPFSMPLEDYFKAMFCPDFTPAQTAWLLREIVQDVTPAALMAEPARRKGYEKLGLPTTYIVTTRDPILPPSWQRRFAGRHHATKIVEIDTPHEPFVSHPALLAETLRDLMAE